jgi:UDP-N-acetylglucosamine:LPS N-acetylglucosamine transferase
MSRHALLLSGHLGAGHDVVAEACAAALAPFDVDHRVLDAIELLGPLSAAGDWVFERLISVPTVYDGFHFTHLRGGSRIARSLDWLSLRNLWRRFEAEVAALPPDLIISVFATGAAAAARYKRTHDDVLTVVFCTDTWVHRLWVHDETDVFLVTSEFAAASVRAYRPRAPVEIVPAPARPAFYAAPTRAEARAALGMAADAPCVLVMSGAWGIGPLHEVAAALAVKGYTVLAVAGRNERLYRRLVDVARANPRVRPYSFTDRVPELMAAANVVVTSSGDTCTEARAVGRGLVLMDVVPGHGRENLMYQLNEGHAAAVMPEPDAIVEAVEAYLDRVNGEDPEPVESRASWEQPFRAALDRAGFPIDAQ